MQIIRVTNDARAVIEPDWLERAGAVHRQLRPQRPPDHAQKMRRVFDWGGEMCVAVIGREVVGVAVYRCFENTHVGRKFYVDDLVTDERHRSRRVGRAVPAFLEQLARGRGGASWNSTPAPSARARQASIFRRNS